MLSSCNRIIPHARPPRPRRATHRVAPTWPAGSVRDCLNHAVFAGAAARRYRALKWPWTTSR